MTDYAGDLINGATSMRHVAGHRWDFVRNGDREGWVVPSAAAGTVMGGSLRIALAGAALDTITINQQVFPEMIVVSSPRDLNIPATGESVIVRARLLNLSPVTDLFMQWRDGAQADDPGDDNGQSLFDADHWGFAQSLRNALKPDVNEWQEIAWEVGPEWQGTIDQIALMLHRPLRGDIWIDTIEIGYGEVRAASRRRPDLHSEHVVPRIDLPGLSQAGFADAFKVLDESLISDVPIYGFTHPVISPGGYYHLGGWWQLDSSLAVSGAKWANQAFADDVMRGFADVQRQNPDGRIDLWGRAAVRGMVGDVSSLPAFFPVAFDIARRTDDRALSADIFETMRKYLDWWLSPVKRDHSTSLISAVFEETFGEPDQAEIQPLTIAPVDLNVAVAVGAHYTSELGRALNRDAEAARYARVFAEISAAINEYLWDDEDGAYYNYDLLNRQLRHQLLVTTFDPLRLRIAPDARRDRLLERMQDPAQFNWGKLPLTSLAMTEPGYVEAEGPYDGRAWFGDIWTLRNLTAIAGLKDSGLSHLAAELNWHTIKAFHSNYTEYLVPSTGEGHGASRYAWSASQYIQALVEHLFGVDFDRLRGEIEIIPHVPGVLYGNDLVLNDLKLPTSDTTRLSVTINQTSATNARILINIAGPLPSEAVRIGLPETETRVVAAAASIELDVS